MSNRLTDSNRQNLAMGGQAWYPLSTRYKPGGSDEAACGADSSWCVCVCTVHKGTAELDADIALLKAEVEACNTKFAEEAKASRFRHGGAGEPGSGEASGGGARYSIYSLY